MYFLLAFLLLAITAAPTNAQQGHGEPCNIANDDCESSLGLYCPIGTRLCECRQGSVYNPVNITCNILVGSECEGTIPCVPHSICHWPDSVCTCDTEFSEYPDGFCASSERGPCDTNEDCNQRELLQCIQGVCRCPHPTNHGHHYIEKICMNSLGSFCTPQDEIKCGYNSTCQTDAKSITGFSCQCTEGFLPGIDAYECKKGYLEPCTIGYPNPDFQPNECADQLGLNCLQGFCKCDEYPSQIWDEGLKLCGGVAGSMCPVGELDGDRPWICHSDFECLNTSPFLSTSGVCHPKASKGPRTNSANSSSNVLNSLSIFLFITIFGAFFGQM